jgi:hypothetical protein
MYNENDVIKSIKILVKDYINAKKMCDFIFGTVESVSPLKIKIDQKLVLEDDELIVGSVFKTEPMTTGETVILLRQSGGQNFYVMDRGEQS